MVQLGGAAPGDRHVRAVWLAGAVALVLAGVCVSVRSVPYGSRGGQASTAGDEGGSATGGALRRRRRRAAVAPCVVEARRREGTW